MLHELTAAAPLSPDRGLNQDGQRISIFVGGFGNNITKPAETTATEFVVIEDIAISPSAFMKAGNQAEPTYRGLTQAVGLAGGRSFVQVESTPLITSSPRQHSQRRNPRTASPTPKHRLPALLQPLPWRLRASGQVWDVLATYYNAPGMAYTAGVINAGELQRFVKYTLYDGYDALIANKASRWASASTPATPTGIAKPLGRSVRSNPRSPGALTIPAIYGDTLEVGATRIWVMPTTMSSFRSTASNPILSRNVSLRSATNTTWIGLAGSSMEHLPNGNWLTTSPGSSTPSLRTTTDSALSDRISTSTPVYPVPTTRVSHSVMPHDRLPRW